MNLRKLYEHLDQDSRRVLHAAADAAARDSRARITIEFFLLSLLRDRTVGPTVMKALDDAGVEAPAIESTLAGQVADEPRSTPGMLPSFDASLAHLLREAWSLAFDEYGDSAVSPVRFFETIARRGDSWPRLVAILPGFDQLDLGRLAVASGESPAGGAAPGPATVPRYPELSRYGYDMVAAARKGTFDPVVGFDPQMQAISSILLRRRQNSVTVVGEAGVGKTACAQGFVDALARGSDRVPEVLHDTPIWALDISALRAGAVVRGALEERLQAIIQEVEETGMILFMDDLHLLFGDQSQGGDALRSVLTSGNVRILGTCGWREWRRHVEPDAGLARRIAPVRVQEPDDEESLSIVNGVAPTLAAHHDVEFGANVLESAVSLSRRYIVGRQLPDKAIVVLDSACARARMAQPPGKDEPTLVGEEEVAGVVSDLTGVPIGGMLSDVSRMARRLEEVLAERVVGQDDALARCAQQARAYLAGLSDRRRPVGALMFCGPSGVGKTETAHALADAMFGGRLLNINMSEYQEAHTVSGLKGAPAGYVGYGEGGVLTEGIRRTPYCVVLLDEIEKAHADVIEMLYQVLDRGWMEDAEGIEADFSNALIVLTTNAGDTVVEKAAMADPPPYEDEFHRSLTAALGRHFPAAFIGRLQLVPYWPLGDDTLAKIAGMRLDRLAEAYLASHRTSLGFDDDVRGWLANRVKTTPQGARFLDGIIASSIRPAIADYVLAKLGDGEPPGDAVVTLNEGEFSVLSAAEAAARPPKATEQTTKDAGTPVEASTGSGTAEEGADESAETDAATGTEPGNDTPGQP